MQQGSGRRNVNDLGMKVLRTGQAAASGPPAPHTQVSSGPEVAAHPGLQQSSHESAGDAPATPSKAAISHSSRTGNAPPGAYMHALRPDSNGSTGGWIVNGVQQTHTQHVARRRSSSDLVKQEDRRITSVLHVGKGMWVRKGATPNCFGSYKDADLKRIGMCSIVGQSDQRERDIVEGSKIERMESGVRPGTSSWNPNACTQLFCLTQPDDQGFFDRIDLTDSVATVPKGNKVEFRKEDGSSFFVDGVQNFKMRWITDSYLRSKEYMAQKRAFLNTLDKKSRIHQATQPQSDGVVSGKEALSGSEVDVELVYKTEAIAESKKAVAERTNLSLQSLDMSSERQNNSLVSPEVQNRDLMIRFQGHANLDVEGTAIPATPDDDYERHMPSVQPVQKLKAIQAELGLSPYVPNTDVAQEEQKPAENGVNLADRALHMSSKKTTSFGFEDLQMGSVIREAQKLQLDDHAHYLVEQHMSEVEFQRQRSVASEASTEAKLSHAHLNPAAGQLSVHSPPRHEGYRHVVPPLPPPQQTPPPPAQGGQEMQRALSDFDRYLEENKHQDAPPAFIYGLMRERREPSASSPIKTIVLM